MASFTANIMPGLPIPMALITTGGVQTVTPWVSFPQGTVYAVILRGPQVKVWNGTAWVLAPPS